MPKGKHKHQIPYCQNRPTRPFLIELRLKSNGGSAGIDHRSLSDFDRVRSKELYKLWNRLASGSYFAPEVKRVNIPKVGGKTRPLGIPTVGDRIAQQVVKGYLEPRLESIFFRILLWIPPQQECTHGHLESTPKCTTLQLCD